MTDPTPPDRTVDQLVQLRRDNLGRFEALSAGKPRQDAPQRTQEAATEAHAGDVTHAVVALIDRVGLSWGEGLALVIFVLVAAAYLLLWIPPRR